MAEEMRVPPPIMWAQRSDKIFLTINVEDLQEPEIKLEEKQLYFKGKGGADKRLYEVTLEFYHDVDIKASKYIVNARNVPMVIAKKETREHFWPRLTKTAAKRHWLKTDFDKWMDSDDSDAEGGPESGDANFEDMMKQMGNFSTEDGGDMGEEEEDSDDEDMPDLA